MISVELLRRYPFFAGFSHDQLFVLAVAADESAVETGHTFFHEEETLSNFFLLLEGSVALTIKIPDRAVAQAKNNHITGDFITRDIDVETLGAGEIFGWSALVPPYKPTAGVKSLEPCRAVSFDMEKIQKELDEDCAFGRAIALKTAHTIRERLRGQRIELLTVS